MILYTSGTTGSPKGVMMGHMNISWFAFQQAARYKAMDSEMVMLIVSPTFNTAAINEQSIPTFLVGGTVVMMPSKGWSADKMSDYIDRYGVTHSLVYPSMLEPFLDADSRRGDHARDAQVHAHRRRERAAGDALRGSASAGATSAS